MKITPQILAAVQQAVEYYGNTSQVAKAMGIAHSTVFFWLKGKTSSMSGKLWQSRIRPVLAPFLQNEATSGSVKYNTGTYSQEQPLVLREDGGNYQVYNGSSGQRDEVDTKETDMLAVVKYSALDQFDPSAESVRKFLKQNEIDQQQHAGISSKTHFVVRLANEYRSAFLPGTDLLIRADEYPDNHRIVLARLRLTGEVVLGRYVRSGNVIKIISLQENAPEISWNCMEELGYTLWCYQVLEAKLDLREI